MNPLTREARRDHKAEARSDMLLAVGCGVVLAVLSIGFLI